MLAYWSAINFNYYAQLLLPNVRYGNREIGELCFLVEFEEQHIHLYPAQNDSIANDRESKNIFD